jgi:hypothetical protein
MWRNRDINPKLLVVLERGGEGNYDVWSMGEKIWKGLIVRKRGRGRWRVERRRRKVLPT